MIDRDELRKFIEPYYVDKDIMHNMWHIELEEKQIFYSIHINSVNEILLKKESESRELDIEAKRRRQSSEKSMSIPTESPNRTKSFAYRQCCVNR